MGNRVLFVVFTHKGDEHLLLGSVERVIKFYPDSPIHVCVDTKIDNNIYEDLVKRGYSVSFHGTKDKISFVYDRFTYLLNNLDFDYLVRFDPDTEVHGYLQIPLVDWAGQIYEHDGYGYGTWGCFSVHSRKALERWMSLEHDGEIFEYRDGISIDGLTQHYMKKLGYEAQDLEGVKFDNFFHRGLIGNFKVTHPCLEKPIRNHLWASVSADREAYGACDGLTHQRPLRLVEGAYRGDSGLYVDWEMDVYFMGKRLGKLEDGLWELWTRKDTIQYRKFLMALGHLKGRIT